MITYLILAITLVTTPCTPLTTTDVNCTMTLPIAIRGGVFKLMTFLVFALSFGSTSENEGALALKDPGTTIKLQRPESNKSFVKLEEIGVNLLNLTQTLPETTKFPKSSMIRTVRYYLKQLTEIAEATKQNIQKIIPDEAIQAFSVLPHQEGGITQGVKYLREKRNKIKDKTIEINMYLTNTKEFIRKYEELITKLENLVIILTSYPDLQKDQMELLLMLKELKRIAIQKNQQLKITINHLEEIFKSVDGNAKGKDQIDQNYQILKKGIIELKKIYPKDEL